LAKGAGAEERRPLMVLERAGHDLGGRGRAAIDQHDQPLALGDVAMARVPALGVLGVAAARRADLALVEEGVADPDRLVEQAAGIGEMVPRAGERARAVGVSAIGEITLISPSSIVTSMPRPPNSPLVLTCMSRKLFASM